MTWFETLTGLPEKSPQQVRRNISVDRQTLTSKGNGKVFACGQLETPTLAELRERVHASGYKGAQCFKISRDRFERVVTNRITLRVGRAFLARAQAARQTRPS